MAEFSIGEHAYRTRKMDVKRQFHVARRLGPLLSHFTAAMPQLMKLAEVNTPEALGDAEIMQQFELMVTPMITELSHMPENDANYILDSCMMVTQRASGANGAQRWQDIWNIRAGALQFEDITLPEMLQIAKEVLTENLAGFFGMGQSVGTAPGVGATPPVLNG